MNYVILHNYMNAIMLGIYNLLIVCIIIVCISSTNWLQILFNKPTYLLTTRALVACPELLVRNSMVSGIELMTLRSPGQSLNHTTTVLLYHWSPFREPTKASDQSDVISYVSSKRRCHESMVCVAGGDVSRLGWCCRGGVVVLMTHASSP